MGRANKSRRLTKNKSKKRTQRRFQKGGVKQDISQLEPILENATWVDEDRDALSTIDPEYYDFIESNVDTTAKQRKAIKRSGIDVDTIINRYRRDYSFVDGTTKPNFSLVNGGLRADNITPIIEPIVAGLDSVFNHPACPRFSKATILFRGGNLDFEYKQVVEKGEPLQKSFISTTKKINTLFDIIPYIVYTPGQKLSGMPIVINILIVDADIPYIDLYNEKSRSIDQIQDEILLPRGLTFEYIATSTYAYNDTHIHQVLENKVYIFYVHK
jgi:hypothetical protein